MELIKSENKQKIDNWEKILQKYKKKLYNSSEELTTLASKLTGSTIKDAQHDLDFVINFIDNIQHQVEQDQTYLLKPKGKVLIGLPSNEPIINTLIPTISALVAGNTIILKPQKQNKFFVKKLIEKFYSAGLQKEKLKVKYVPRQDLKRIIKKCDFVFWAGGHKSSLSIVKICADLDKKFNIESEGNSICFIDETVKTPQLKNILKQIIKNIEIHSGSRCQTIRGLLIHKGNYATACNIMKNLNLNIKISKKPGKRKMLNPYFGQRLWVKKFENNKLALEILAENQFSLCLHVFSKKKNKEILRYLKIINYSIITINQDPNKLPINLPWGGTNKSGNIGPEKWINKFSDKNYVVM